MKKTNIAVVSFDSGRDYDFKNDIEVLAIGDMVVVDTVNGVAVATVVGIKDISKTATKWVIQKVDLDAHKARLAQDKIVIELKAKMEARRKELEEVNIYRILAKEDNSMAELLAQLDQLN